LEVSTAFIKVSPALEFYDRPLKELTNVGKEEPVNKGFFFAKGCMEFFYMVSLNTRQANGRGINNLFLYRKPLS